MHDSDKGFWGFMTTILFITIISMHGCNQVEGTRREREKTKQEAIKNGLVQKPIPGVADYTWTTPDAK